MGHMESLRTDLSKLIETYSGSVHPDLAAAIATAAPVNASPRRDYRDYYDQELRELVADRDWAIVESYNYSF